MVGTGPAFQAILKSIQIVAPTDATVLILGETGTGKELVARAIHELSSRNRGSFVKVNCAAIPASLLESELFGHEKGSFTGAVAQKMGRFELAHQGTLFLDEIGEMPLELQPKLLRAIQDLEFERVGGNRTIRTDVRAGRGARRRRRPTRPEADDVTVAHAEIQYRPPASVKPGLFLPRLPVIAVRRTVVLHSAGQRDSPCLTGLTRLLASGPHGLAGAQFRGPFQLCADWMSECSRRPSEARNSNFR